MMKPMVFISYSRQDEQEKDRLLAQLDVLAKDGLLEVWSDHRIQSGADWKAAIQEAMERAKVAILLVTANFLTSDFILSQEVPALLKRRQTEGLTIIPLFARDCVWQRVGWLSALEIRPKDGLPIWGRGVDRVDEQLALIAREIAGIVEEEQDLTILTEHHSEALPPQEQALTGPAAEIDFLIPISEAHQALFKPLLQKMFPGYRRVEVEQELAEGSFSGSWVFRVRPKSAKARNLRLVVKIAARSLIDKEWQAFIHNIHEIWPYVAGIKETPVYSNDGTLGGICYTLAGQDAFNFTSLRRYCLEKPLPDIQTVLDRRLAEILRKGLAENEERVDGFLLQASFDRLLPVNLLITVANSQTADQPVGLSPTNIPPTLPIGATVRVSDFVVTKVDAKDRTVTLNTSASQTGTPTQAYTIRLKFDPVVPLPAYAINQPLPEPVTGLVAQTREQQWLAEMGKVLNGRPFDLAAERITLPDGTDLPNPFRALPAILKKRPDVKVSFIHGDLNLENILAQQDGHEVWVIDFSEARRDYVLHDYLRLETEVITKILPDILSEAGLSYELIVPFYRQLHLATFARSETGDIRAPDRALDKPFAILKFIRQAARDYGLLNPRDQIEYYNGLTVYLLGALKFVNLDKVPPAPLPKQLAFWGAAAIRGVVAEPPAPTQVIEAKVEDVLAEQSHLTKKEGKKPMGKDHKQSGGVFISGVQGSITGATIAGRDIIQTTTYNQGQPLAADQAGPTLPDLRQLLQEVHNQLTAVEADQATLEAVSASTAHDVHGVVLEIEAVLKQTETATGLEAPAAKRFQKSLQKAATRLADVVSEAEEQGEEPLVKKLEPLVKQLERATRMAFSL